MTDVASAVSTGFTTMVGDLIDMVVAILPIALTLLGVTIGVAYAVKWIKKLVK